MKDAIANMWDERYKEKNFSYGKNPNEFFKNQIQRLEKGKILFGAEGEGRNAVYAAKLGWDVFAFDISQEGKNKALQLAAENKVSIDYTVGLLPELDYKKNEFDAIALIFAHFPAKIRTQYHQILNEKLKLGGIIILEAFSKNHIQYQGKNNAVGGPKNIESMMSLDIIKKDFTNFEILKLAEEEVILSEGQYHNGTGHVVRFVGKKR